MAISLEYLAAIYITAKYQYFTGLGRKNFNPKTASLAGRGAYRGKKLQSAQMNL